MSTFMQMDIEQMRSELNVLEEAIEVFRTYVENGFKNEIELVSAMQSEFTSSLKDILENMEEKNAVDVLEKLEQYHKTALFIVDTLERDVDEAMAREIGGNTNG